MRSPSPLLIPDSIAALRRNNFDALRLALALLVVWSHSFALWKGSETDEPLSLLLNGTYNSGNVAVLAFFVISGFLITLSYARAASWKTFLSRRIGRIVPGYLVAITLCSLVVVPIFSSRGFGQLAPFELAGLASNIVLRNYIIASDAFDGGPVNGSLWSIPYEFWCYLGVMGLGLFGFLKRRWVYPALALAVMAVRVWLDLTKRRPGGGLIEQVIGFPYFWFLVLPPFLLGGAVYILRGSIVRDRRLLFALILITIIAAHLPIDELMRSVVTRLLLPPTLAYLVFYVVFSPRLRLHDAARYGDFSYGAYLYAFPIQQMLASSFKGVVTFPIYVAMSMICTVIAGAASWTLVERWCLRRLRRPEMPLQEEAAIVAP